MAFTTGGGVLALLAISVCLCLFSTADAAAARKKTLPRQRSSTSSSPAAAATATPLNSVPGTVYNLNANLNYNLFNPRSADALFVYDTLSTTNDSPLDNAGIFEGPEESLNMATIPFNRFGDITAGIDLTRDIFEMCVRSNDPISVGPQQKIRAQVRFAAQSVDVLPQPFPKSYVTRPLDDFRLASNNWYLSDNLDTGIELGIVATDEGVWANYNHRLNVPARFTLGYSGFQVFRRIANRNKPRSTPYDNYDDSENASKPSDGGDYVSSGQYPGTHPPLGGWINAAIEYDRSKRTATWYIDGKQVWQVGDIGKLTDEITNDPKNRLLAQSPGSNNEMDPSRFYFYPLCNSHQLDLGDPWKKASLANNPGLQRLTTSANYYVPGMKFFDELGQMNYTYYGQGQTGTIQTLKLTRSNSETTAAPAAANQGGGQNGGGYSSANFDANEYMATENV